MGKVVVLAIVVACYCGILSAAKPMEALNRYNVVLIHGAAPEDQGFGSECNGTIHDAYAIASNNITKSDSTIGSRLGSAIGMLGDYDRTFNPNKDEDYNEKSAKKLTFWLDSAVFEDYQYRNGEIFMDSVNVFSSPYIYLQRAFTNPADVTSQMGEASDYNAPVKSGNLWKLVPKDASRPTLFYSESVKRVVRMNTVVNGSSAEIALEYCDSSCPLPGTLKKTEITTTLLGGEKSTVVMEIVSARARHILPAKMFDIE